MFQRVVIYNPYDPDVILNPYPVYQQLRDEAPAYHNEEMGFWAITRYDDVLNAFLDPHTFISSEGNLIDGADKGNGFLIGMDPPEHTWYRKVLAPWFTLREMSRLEPFIRARAVEYLDAVEGEASFDLVETFALRIPLDVISELLGIPTELRAHVHELSDRLTARTASDDLATEPHDAMVAGMELDRLLREIVLEHRKQARDDLTSRMIDAEITNDAGESWRMPDEQIAAQMQLLAFAGHETVTNLIGNGAVALWWYPDQRRELVDDPSLMKQAVEEMLRWDNPAPLQGRWSTRDVELHGQVIPKDSRVMIVMGAATHDDRVYTEPELFDIHRVIERPLGLGFGMHLCLGAHLARLELRIAFEELLTRHPEYELDVAGIQRSMSPSFRGHARIPLVIR